MDEDKKTTNPKNIQPDLQEYLKILGLPFMHDNFEILSAQAAKDGWSHVSYLEALAHGEAALRRDRSIERRIRMARFPVIKTIEQFRWSWPSLINRASVQNLFRLKFLEEKTNVIFLGGVGLGKTRLASALGYAACLQGRSVLFATAVDVINTLSVALAANRLKSELKKYLSPSLLILDELGFLPLDKRGADLLFQIISLRYEQGSLIITSNRLCGAPHNLFNAESTVMRSPLFAGPANLS
jgi:DNA replication protein DnaC